MNNLSFDEIILELNKTDHKIRLIENKINGDIRYVVFKNKKFGETKLFVSQDDLTKYYNFNGV